MAPSLVDLDNLTVEFPVGRGVLRAVDRFRLTIEEGESLGLVGESGCGKTVTALSLMRLLPRAGQVSGEIRFRGRDLLALDEPAMRKLRGREIAMVFQEPMRSMNPVLRCGEQVAESMRVHLRLDSRASRSCASDLLEQVGLRDVDRLYNAYPHELSGGMRQRVMIAMALACDPLLLVADEPTTALDVTVQAQIVRLLGELKRSRNLAVLFISHNLALVSEACRRVAVMYAGRLVELVSTEILFCEAAHPYTRALIGALPRIDGPVASPVPIPGDVPHPLNLPPGCRFNDRCALARSRSALAQRRCRLEEPPMTRIADGHWVRCWVASEEKGTQIS